MTEEEQIEIRSLSKRMDEIKKDLHGRIGGLESTIRSDRMAFETRMQRQTDHTNDALNGINRELGEISTALGLKADKNDVTQTRISIMRHREEAAKDKLKEIVKADKMSKAMWIKVIGAIIVAVASAFGIQISM